MEGIIDSAAGAEDMSIERGIKHGTFSTKANAAYQACGAVGLGAVAGDDQSRELLGKDARGHHGRRCDAGATIRKDCDERRHLALLHRG